VAAIQFALNNPEGMEFLRLWNEGEFDTLRREWPDAPSEVYVGADPLATAQRPAGDGCHCATCTCEPNMTPALRFDLSPAQKEGAIREHLIRLGWTPPDEHATAPLQAEIEALRAEVDRVKCELMDAITRAERLAKALRGMLAEYEALHAKYDLGECQATVDARAAIQDQEDGND